MNRSSSIRSTRRLLVGGVAAVAFAFGFATVDAQNSGDHEPSGQLSAQTAVVAFTDSKSVPTQRVVAADALAADALAADVVADVDVVDDVEEAKAAAGNVKVGDTCDKIDPVAPEIPLDPLAMRPVVEYSPDGTCTVVGWSYLGLPPEGAPGLMPPDEDGFIPVPVYADDGSVDHLDLPSPEERQSLRDYVASTADLEIAQD